MLPSEKKNTKRIIPISSPSIFLRANKEIEEPQNKVTTIKEKRLSKQVKKIINLCI